MTAIQGAMLGVLKDILKERYVSHLRPLLWDEVRNHEDRDRKEISRAFSAFVLQSSFGLDAKTAALQVVDDHEDNGIDALYYHEEDKTLYLVQSKLKATEQFKQEEAQAFGAGVRSLVNNELDGFNKNFQDQRTSIEQALDICDSIKLLVAYTGDGISLHAKTVLKDMIEDIQENEDRLSPETIFFDAEKVEAALKEEQSVKLVNTKLKIQSFRQIEQPQRTVFGLVDINDLVTLHERYDRALYEKNIRYFIGVGKHGVNRAINNTLGKQPDKFLYLNNGITMVCNSLQGRSAVRGSKVTKNFELLGTSVVNGAQTISSAVQFKRDNPKSDISAAKVMVTVIQVKDSNEFHKEVTKARNLQNPVSLSDFASLDDVQEILKREFALYGMEYHYRPQAENTSSVSVVTIEELAKSLACLHYDIRYAAYLKSEPGRFTNIDNEHYKSIFNSELNGSSAVNAVQVYLVITDILKHADWSSPSPEKLVYRHCVYALSSILMKQLADKINGSKILGEEEIRLLLSGPLDDMRQVFFDEFQNHFESNAPHAIFKRVGETSKLILNVMIRIQDREQDPNVIGMKNRVGRLDTNNQNLFNYLSGKAEQI